MEVKGRPKTGGEYGNLRNRALLQKVCDEVTIIEIPKIGLYKHAVNLITGKSYGFTSRLMNIINSELKNHYDYVFFDGSVYGYLVRLIKQRGFHTIVFFHNVEFVYYKAKFDSQKTIMNFSLVYYIKHQEKLSQEFADKVICINDRDENGIKTLYD